jgi:hypothetical protein
MNCFLLLLLLFLDYSGKDLLAAAAKMLPMIGFATVSVILKVIVMSRKEKITFLNIVTAWVFALGICVLAYPIILESIQPPYVGAVTGVVVLTGENLVSYIVYKFKLDEFLTWFINDAFEKAKSFFK